MAFCVCFSHCTADARGGQFPGGGKGAPEHCCSCGGSSMCHSHSAKSASNFYEILYRDPLVRSRALCIAFCLHESEDCLSQPFPGIHMLRAPIVNGSEVSLVLSKLTLTIYLVKSLYTIYSVYLISIGYFPTSPFVKE